MAILRAGPWAIDFPISYFSDEPITLASSDFPVVCAINESTTWPWKYSILKVGSSTGYSIGVGLPAVESSSNSSGSSSVFIRFAYQATQSFDLTFNYSASITAPSTSFNTSCNAQVSTSQDGILFEDDTGVVAGSSSISDTVTVTMPASILPNFTTISSSSFRLTAGFYTSSASLDVS